MAPALKPPKTYSSSSKVVRTIAATRGCSCERRLMSSTPSMFGIRASTRATSGLASGMSRSSLRCALPVVGDCEAHALFCEGERRRHPAGFGVLEGVGQAFLEGAVEDQLRFARQLPFGAFEREAHVETRTLEGACQRGQRLRAGPFLEGQRLQRPYPAPDLRERLPGQAPGFLNLFPGRLGSLLLEPLGVL